jgi:hypothetical protein
MGRGTLATDIIRRRTLVLAGKDREARDVGDTALVSRASVKDNGRAIGRLRRRLTRRQGRHVMKKAQGELRELLLVRIRHDRRCEAVFGSGLRMLRLMLGFGSP